jgi:hypothetical protein
MWHVRAAAKLHHGLGDNSRPRSHIVFVLYGNSNIIATGEATHGRKYSVFFQSYPEKHTSKAALSAVC